MQTGAERLLLCLLPGLCLSLDAPLPLPIHIPYPHPPTHPADTTPLMAETYEKAPWRDNRGA